MLGAQVVEAQEPFEETRQRFEIAVGTWISTGDTAIGVVEALIIVPKPTNRDSV